MSFFLSFFFLPLFVIYLPFGFRNTHKFLNDKWATDKTSPTQLAHYKAHIKVKNVPSFAHHSLCPSQSCLSNPRLNLWLKKKRKKKTRHGDKLLWKEPAMRTVFAVLSRKTNHSTHQHMDKLGFRFGILTLQFASLKRLITIPAVGGKKDKIKSFSPRGSCAPVERSSSWILLSRDEKASQKLLSPR